MRDRAVVITYIDVFAKSES